MASPKPEPASSGLQTRQSSAGERATKRRGHPDDAPWTASRCLRTLRRLESQLALLRKILDTPIHVHCAHGRSTTAAEPPAKRPKAHYGENEKTERSKRHRHTYGGRSRTRKTLAEPAPSASPTRRVRPLRDLKPRLPSNGIYQRTLGPQTSHGPFDAPDTASLDTSCYVTECVAKDRERAFEEILGWLSTLLFHTLPARGEAHPKSLLGMCLRKIPACIDDIEAWDKARAQDEAPNSIRQTPDVALDMYSQLEAFGAAGLGWRPMKQTLRAHGLRMLKKAIAEGTIDSSQAAALIKSCLHNGFVVEATQLVMRPDGPYPSPRSESDCMAGHPGMESLYSLLGICRSGQSRPAEPVFDLVCKLIKQKQLSPSWFCTTNPPHLFQTAVEAIGKQRGSTAAFGLITEGISALCTVLGGENCRKRNDKSLRWIKVIAAAMVALSGPGTCVGDRIAETRASFAMDCCINQVRTQKRLDSQEALFVLSLARFLIGGGSVSDGDQPGLATLLNDVAADGRTRGASSLPSHHYHNVMDLICFAAEECSSKFKEPAHEALVPLLHKIEQLSWPGWVFKGLRKDGPFVLAQNTHDLRDLAFAESQQLLQTDSSPSQRSGTIFSSWCWDEMIGEFVGRSPQKEEGGSPNAPQSRSQPQPQDYAPQGSQLPRPQSSPTVNGEAAEIAEGSDDGLELRSENGMAGGKQSRESMTKRNRKTSDNTQSEASKDSEARAAQGTIKRRQWKPATKPAAADKGLRPVKLGLASDDTSPAPIGGARQLFIVRGSSRRSVGEDHDWLDW